MNAHAQAHRPDLVDARQRVHDDHLLLGSRHQLRVDDEQAARLGVVDVIVETLLLNARHVEHVRVGDD